MKNRKKLLALMLGMSLAVTFPVQAADIEKTSDTAIEKDIQTAETETTEDSTKETASEDTEPKTDTDQANS